ncbi:hypothetical protein V3596_11710 [Roseateles sp. MS17]
MHRNAKPKRLSRPDCQASSEERVLLGMAPVGREFGCPDYERWVRLDQAASDTELQAFELVRKGTRWLNSATVDASSRKTGNGVRADLSNSYSMACRWAEEGKIFGINLDGTMLFPAYAFEPSGQPVLSLQDVLKVLTGMSPFAIAAWFESPSSTLGGMRPRELLASDSNAVIAAARTLREGPLQG